MGQNDVIALSSNFENWKEERSVGLTDVSPFTYYCVEHFLKPYDLGDEDILYGITDGPNDGGVDALYVITSRRLLVRDDIDFDPTEYQISS